MCVGGEQGRGTGVCKRQAGERLGAHRGCSGGLRVSGKPICLVPSKGGPSEVLASRTLIVGLSDTRKWEPNCQSLPRASWHIRSHSGT